MKKDEYVFSDPDRLEECRQHDNDWQVTGWNDAYESLVQSLNFKQWIM